MLRGLRPTRQGTRVGETYALPPDAVTPQEREQIKKALTVQAKMTFGVPPPPFLAWREDADGTLHAPRFYGLEHFGPAEVDARALGEAVDLAFVGELTPVQKRATDVIFARQLAAGGSGGVTVSLPCGYGKTVWAVAAIARLGRKACVLVHKTVLLDQWRAAFERFCPGARVGVLQGDKCELEGTDVVLAMVLTVAKRAYDPAVMACFGTVVCDEAHHMAAPVMNTAMRAFRARHVIGLTATRERPDGLECLLDWSLGAEGFKVERDCEGVRVTVATYRDGGRERLDRAGKPMLAIMLNELTRNPARNAFIADRVAAMRKAGRVVIVLSDRLQQIHALRAMIVQRGVPDEEVGTYTGATKKADVAAQLSLPVVVCLYGMANEGLDKKECDTIVMASPKSRVIQCIGRCQRPCPTKQAPLVLDVADAYSVFHGLSRKRQALYAKERYEVQYVDADAAKAEDWFT